MNSGHEQETDYGYQTLAKPRPLWAKILLGGFLPGMIFLGAISLMMWLLKTAPESRRKNQQDRSSVLVQVQTVRSSEQRVVIEAMGTVIPAREVILYPRVRGQIVSMDKEFQPGGLFSRGRVLLRIDPRDYQWVLQQRQSELARAEAELKVEMGKQWIAQREFEMLGKRVPQKNRDLMLRHPQMAMAQAAVQLAQAALEKARFDLNQATLRVPFPAVVSTVDVNLGSHVAENTRLTRLVGTEAYWISLSVPVDQLRWFKLPQSSQDAGATVRIYNEPAWGRGVFRTGQVIRLNPALEDQGRMAQVLVAIKDPLLLETKPSPNTSPPKLLLGSFVRAEILGQEASRVIVVKHEFVHNDHVWVMNANHRLEIRPIQILWRNAEQCFVSAGLQDQERIVTSIIPIPVAGMSLRLDVPTTPKSKKRASSPSSGKTSQHTKG